MSSLELLTPTFEGGIRSINFFNGRVLSGEDLSKEQEANREGRRLLGRAIGEGIAFGLEVSKAVGAGTKPIVTVKPGLAVNRKGDTLCLTGTVDLSLVRPQNGVAPSTPDSVFTECKPAQAGVYVSGAGGYLLTVAPARGREGSALVSGLGNAPAACNRKYLVEGLQFRLIQLDLTPDELNDEKRLRNIIAYKCFGQTSINSFLKNPFGPAVTSYGLLDDLRPNRVTDCDIPLAVLYWTTTEGIKFVDMWSVRRRLIAPVTANRWNVVTADRRSGEAEAMLLQFEDQLESMRLDGLGLETVVATEYFRYLPPLGIIPVLDVKSPQGFDHLKFFSGLTYRDPVHIEGAKVESFIRSSLSYSAIDLSNKEVLWLYWVRENKQAVDDTTLNPLQQYLVFASGHIPYQGNARYDVARWDYSNYAWV